MIKKNMLLMLLALSAISLLSLAFCKSDKQTKEIAIEEVFKNLVWEVPSDKRTKEGYVLDKSKSDLLISGEYRCLLSVNDKLYACVNLMIWDLANERALNKPVCLLPIEIEK